MEVAAAAVSASTFSSGVSRLELLVRAARILEGLAASKHAGGAPQDALALRLITIQVRPLSPLITARQSCAVVARPLHLYGSSRTVFEGLPCLDSRSA